MAPKECPKCAKNPDYGDFWAQTDRLYMEFESEVQSFTLFTVYWCRRCNYFEQKKWDTEIIHDQSTVGEEK